MEFLNYQGPQKNQINKGINFMQLPLYPIDSEQIAKNYKLIGNKWK